MDANVCKCIEMDAHVVYMYVNVCQCMSMYVNVCKSM